MFFLINGRSSATVMACDRGLQYGDGLFETLAVSNGRPCLWQRHMQRLQHGCTRLGIPAPEPKLLLDEVEQLVGSARRGVVKIIVTRGSGGRGYRPPEKSVPTRIIQFSDWPGYSSDIQIRGVQVRLCRTRLGLNPSLAGLKTLNRLEQVMARAEWDQPEILEGLMQDTEDRVIEGTMSNLFLVQGDRLRTPRLSRSGTAGIMRGLVFEKAAAIGIGVCEEDLGLEEVEQADGMFLSNSLIGIWPIRRFSGISYDPAAVPRPLLTQIMDHGFRFG